MNEAIDRLQPYPFEKLARLRASVTPSAAKTPINLSIGEPGHPAPDFITEELSRQLGTISRYPTTRGGEELRNTIAKWLIKRFNLPASSINAENNILPANGTREALFAIAQCVVDGNAARATVVMPNPFYQIYEGAALLARAEPWYVNCHPSNDYQPDFESVPETIWQSCQLLYLCTPGNPTGAVLSLEQLAELMELADRHDFIIASDECYSEIYFDEENPPIGLLEAAARTGRDNYHRCLVFHSLSKRSNVPGMRSGFVAGDPALIKKFLLYRTYHGCSMPLYTQAASVAAWQDEQHVRDNRALYADKFKAVLKILKPVISVERPSAGFYLWPELPDDDTGFARGLLESENVTVLPGSFLARQAGNHNPGKGFVRIALVAPREECTIAAERIRDYLLTL